MVHVIQTKTTDVIAVFTRDRGEELFDCVDLVGDGALEDGAVDEIGFDLLAIDAVEAGITAGVD